MLAKSNGSQCGFCTSGFVMSLYALLRNNPTPSVAEIEEALDGNLCRCTGYRPIFEAACSFAKEGVNQQKICPSSGQPCGCGVSSPRSPLPEHSHEEPTALLHGQKHLLFPNKLRRMNKRELHIVGRRSEWFKPLTLDSLLRIKEQHGKHVTFVSGNTENGIDVRFKNVNFPILVSPMYVAELCKITVEHDGIRVGSSVTLTGVKLYLEKQLIKLPKNRTRGFVAALENLKWFASTPIRNVATLGGNLSTASPISDLNPVWSALGCYVNIVNTKMQYRKVLVRDFFIKYRVVDLKEDEIVESLFIPYTSELEFARAFKQSKRREDDIAIVNAGMRVKVSNDENGSFIFQEVGLSFGGMSFKTVNASKTESYLKGKLVGDERVFNEAINLLKEDLPLTNNAPGGMIEYRRTLTISFFYKFWLHVQNEVLHNVPQELISTFETFKRSTSSGEQYYEIKPKGTAVGTPNNHLSATLQTTGEAKYLDDMPKVHNELQAYYVLSTQPHAKFSIDASEALKMPGVKGFFSASDAKRVEWGGGGVDDEEIFRKSTVTAVGQPLGIIVATTYAEAKSAAKKVQVSYEALEPVILSIEEAITHKSFIGSNHKLGEGDVDQGFVESDVVLEGDIKIGGQEHFYLETNQALSIPKENDELVVYSSSQYLTELQRVVSHLLGIPQHKIVTKLRRVGGGFGGKETRSILIGFATAFAAHKLGVPVRMVLDRDVDMMVTGQRHPFYATYKVGVKQNGTLHSLDLKLYNNAGYSLDLSQAVMDRALLHCENAYKIRNIKIEGYCCKTNLPSNTAYRGFGGPQAMFIIDSIMDHIATKLSIEPMELKQLNLYKTNQDTTYYGQQVSGQMIQLLWSKCKQHSDYENRVKLIQEFNKNNKNRKRGISILITKFGIGFIAAFLNQGAALLHVYADGSVLVSTGGVEIGQGLHTKVAAVVATALNIPMGRVYIAETSTKIVINTSATAGSMGSDLYGQAALDACQQLMKRLEPIYQKLGKNALWEDVVSAAYFDRINLSSQGFYKVPHMCMDWETGKGTPFSYYTHGAAVSEVEVDTLTGDVQILRSDVVMDIGDSLNPHIDIGQVEGAFVQGIGLFTMEELVFGDKNHPWIRDQGSLFTRGPGTYKIPSLNDVPIDFKVHLVTNAPNPFAVYSSKAVGEPPLYLGCSVFFAVKDAIKAARKQNLQKDDYFVMDSPATPERIRMLCGDSFAQQFVKDDFRAKGSF